MFYIMTDQSADITNKEQWVICFCCVDDDFEIHKDLTGLYPITKYKSWHYCYNNFGFHWMGLKIGNTRGQCQCYDGAATMSGTKHGIATQIKILN